MLKRLKWAVVAALLIWPVAQASAVPIALRPDMPLSGAAGSIIGWGYEVTGDPAFDLVFTSINADILSGDGDVSTAVFDFPFVAAGGSVSLDYDAVAGLGLVEILLSPLLNPGAMVTARVYGDYERRDSLGALIDTGTWERDVTAQVTQISDIPEPDTWLMLGTGLVLAVCGWLIKAGSRPRA